MIGFMIDVCNSTENKWGLKVIDPKTRMINWTLKMLLSRAYSINCSCLLFLNNCTIIEQKRSGRRFYASTFIFICLPQSPNCL